MLSCLHDVAILARTPYPLIVFNDPSFLFWLVVAFAAMFLLPYVVGPILLRLTMTQQADPEVVPFPIDHPELPQPVREHFDDVTDELTAIGFDSVAGLALPRQMANVKAVILMFANRTTKDAAIATAIYADKLDPPLQTAYVEIISRYRDGTLVQTNNSNQIGAFPTKQGVTTTQISTVTKADRLYRVHQALAERHGSSAGKLQRLDEEFHGDAAAYRLGRCVKNLKARSTLATCSSHRAATCSGRRGRAHSSCAGPFCFPGNRFASLAAIARRLGSSKNCGRKGSCSCPRFVEADMGSGNHRGGASTLHYEAEPRNEDTAS